MNGNFCFTATHVSINFDYLHLQFFTNDVAVNGVSIHRYSLKSSCTLFRIIDNIIAIFCEAKRTKKTR